MLETGFAIGMGLLLLMVKMSWKWKLRLLSHPFVTDLLVFILMCYIHGTSGQALIVAGIAAGTCSLALSVGRKLYGHRSAGEYIPGFFNIGHLI